jgi:hypothetical protein
MVDPDGLTDCLMQFLVATQNLVNTDTLTHYYEIRIAGTQIIRCGIEEIVSGCLGPLSL